MTLPFGGQRMHGVAQRHVAMAPVCTAPHFRKSPGEHSALSCDMDTQEHES